MNQGVSIRWGSALAVTVVLLLGAAAPARLVAQSAGTISGAVLDQLAKAIPGAKVTAKSENGSVSGSATTDGDGHFTIGGLAAGTYSVETTSPGFALNTRRGVHVSASGTAGHLDHPVRRRGFAIGHGSGFGIAGGGLGPAGQHARCDFRQNGDQQRRDQNFMAPVADFAEVIQQAPGTFSLNPNGIGLGQGKSFFRGFPTASTP